MSQRDWFEKDFYKVLGVSPEASKADIKKAYRKLAQEHHPDANKGDAAAEARFKEISEAHAILANDEKRKEYDELRSLWAAGGQRFYGFQPPGGGRNVRVNIGDLGDLEDIFGGAGGGLFEDLLGGVGGRGRARATRGADLESEVELAFEDAMRGTTLTLASGGKVRVPPGVGDGARVRVAGRGEQGSGGGSRGDLYVRVRVQPHPFFQRGPRGELLVPVPVTFPEAALGAQVTVPTLDEPVTVKVPPGTPNGKLMRVRGKGPLTSRGGRADLLVKVMVEVPQKLTKKERELLEEFARVHKASPRDHLNGHSAEASAARAEPEQQRR